MINKFKQLRKEASLYANENLWHGVVYSSHVNIPNVYPFDISHDWYKFNAVIELSYTAEQVFEMLIEGTHGASFHMRNPDGIEVDRNSFSFSCTITEKDGTSREFTGTSDELKLECYTTRLSNVKVIK